MFGNQNPYIASTVEALQFGVYDKVMSQYFAPEVRRQLHINVFPEDCRKASALGARLADATP